MPLSTASLLVTEVAAAESAKGKLGHGFTIVFAKSKYWRGWAGCATGISEPNSAVELPPNVLVVPGMFTLPNCQKHWPPTLAVEKIG